MRQSITPIADCSCTPGANIEFAHQESRLSPGNRRSCSSLLLPPSKTFERNYSAHQLQKEVPTHSLGFPRMVGPVPALVYDVFTSGLLRENQGMPRPNAPHTLASKTLLSTLLHESFFEKRVSYSSGFFSWAAIIECLLRLAGGLPKLFVIISRKKL